MSDPKPKKKRWSMLNMQEMHGAGLVSTVGISLVLCSGLGTALGYWVDNKWNTEPWGIAIGFMFGTAAGFVEMFHMIQKANRHD